MSLLRSAASIIPTEKSAPAGTGGIMDRKARSMVLRLLSRMEQGMLHLEEGAESRTYGRLNPQFPLEATIRVHHPGFFRGILLGGSVGAGETYMRGWWSTDCLTDVIRIVLRNRMVMEDMDRGWSRLTAPIHRLSHILRRNTQRGSRKNIVAHYDLGNDFYALFLDDTWTYSCGIFERDDSSLAEASSAKYERICRKLRLRPEHHVVEIGSGWGGFAMHAADRYGCRVTTTTISEQQYEMARRRIRDAGLSERVEVVKEDYRNLTGRFDRLVSIEMIEAVGHQYLETFFAACSRLLKEDGLMALQAITMGDHVFDRHKHDVDFIKRYIFPGSCIPSITAMNRAASRRTDLRLFHLEDITPHYARTLREWRRRFFNNIERVKEMGFPDMFIRMWEFYLCYCEAGFTERYIGDVQMIFAKPMSREQPILPPLA
ncbi:MAG TPA: class I SAM-dependent methyltransferase [Desulfobacterales bacterium]